jgi:hypothetical protein
VTEDADKRQNRLLRYLQNSIRANRAASVTERVPRKANAPLRQHPLADARGSVAAQFRKCLTWHLTPGP